MKDNRELRDILKVEGVNARGFGTIPKAVMQDRELTPEAKAIYAYFCSYAGSGTNAFPAVEKIMYDLCMSKDRYYRHFNILVTRGYIRVEKKRGEDGRFLNNVYTLVQKPVLREVDTRHRRQEDSQDSPFPENPDTGNPYTENQETNINSTNINNIKINNNIKDTVSTVQGTDNNPPSEDGGNDTRPEAGVVVELDKLFFEITGRSKRSLFEKLLKVYDSTEIFKQLEYLKRFSENNVVDNPEGFLIQALRENWETYRLDRSRVRIERRIEETRRLLESYGRSERAGPNRGPELIREINPWIVRRKKSTPKNRDGPNKGGDESEDSACDGN